MFWLSFNWLMIHNFEKVVGMIYWIIAMLIGSIYSVIVTRFSSSSFISFSKKLKEICLFFVFIVSEFLFPDSLVCQEQVLTPMRFVLLGFFSDLLIVFV